VPRDALFHAAISHHNASRLDAADAAYADLLALHPNDVPALHAWALLAAQQQNFAAALDRIDRALALAPTEAALHNTRGRLLDDLHRTGEAIAAYTRAIQLNPTLAEAHNNLGRAAGLSGNLHQSIDAYRRATQLEPSIARFHTNLALALRRAGQPEAALASHERAVTLDPQSAEAHNSHGNTLRQLDQPAEAIAAYRRAIALAPRYAAAHSNLAAALADTADSAAALAAAEISLAIDPTLPEAHNHHGFAMASAGRFLEAAAAYRRAIALQPTYAEAHSNLALALLDAADEPNAPPLDQEMILAPARRAIELEPNLGPAHTNLAQILLTLGRLKEGWRENEWRFRCTPRYRARPFARPQWLGELLDNRTLLIHAEQGLGDAIQFIRYAPVIAAAHPAARVVVETHRELLELFAGLAGIAQLIPAGDSLPPFDLHCPLLSLPLAFGTTLETIPATVDYLHAQPHLIEQWTRALGPRAPGEKRVGLVWAGRPTHHNDRRRSMLLADFAPLAAIPNVTFHSLQKGPAAEQAKRPPTGLRLIDHTAELEDFMQTAALIGCLDAVIAVDTAVAHLAGAMGKPVLLLLPRSADWRWLRGRSDSPWYPTMRIVRQCRWGEWGDAVERLAMEIKMY
jgi:tetratricopeptide (TPR) repeat protein